MRLKHLKDIEALKKSSQQHQEVKIQVNFNIYSRGYVVSNFCCIKFYLSAVSRKRGDVETMIRCFQEES